MLKPVSQIPYRSLAVSRAKNINKRFQRTGRIHITAGYHEGMPGPMPLSGPQRYTAQLQNIQKISVAEFILERKSDYIKGVQRLTIFQRTKGDVFIAQEFFSIEPGRVAPFGYHPGNRIQNSVQYFQAQMADANFIYIGKH